MINPAPAPEGVLDPQQPWWPTANMRDSSWDVLKAKLTGRPMPGGTQYETWVRLSEGDADKLIANIKKYGKYPQVNQNGAQGGYENLEAYQKWLVEEFLEKPFRDETNKKIEDVAIEARLKEIQEEKIEELKKKAEKDKETVPLDRKEEEKIEEQDEKQTVEEVDKITEEIDKPEDTPKDTPEEKTEDTEEDTDKDFNDISDCLKNIKASISSQISIASAITDTNAGSVRTLGAIKDIFKTQTELLKKQIEDDEFNKNQAQLEQTNAQSGSESSTSTLDSGDAKAKIINVDKDIITIKPIEGNFKEGQEISTSGGGGFDLIGMIKGIAGKFGKSKGGGGGSPIKMSQGGFLNSPYPSQSMAQGGFAPGVYDKPTRGNLLPGQAVIPMNRNVGKKIFGGDKEAQKKQQPLIDTMSQPLKAVGLAILTTAGNFIRSLGPLAGFFLPYAKGLVSGFAKVLGVPIAIIESLLGGPAYAAAQEQDKQQNVFAKLWAEVMEKFGFGFLFDSGKDKKKKTGSTPSTATGEWGPLLDVIAAGEGNYTSVNPGLQRPEILDKTISELVAWQHQSIAKDGGTAASGRYQMLHPETYAKNAGLSMDEKFTPENQDKMAAAYIENKRGGKDWKAGKITDEDFGKQLAMEWAALEYPGKGGGFYDGDGRNQAKVSFEKVKGALEKVKAERGVQIKVKDDPALGKLLGWSVINGPNSGYPVGDNLTMHGEEAYLQHENGMSILPIENNEYSLSKNPIGTLDRWKEILGPSNSVNVNGEYETGGTKVFDPKVYKGDALSSRYLTVGEGANEKSYTIMYDREGATGTYNIKAISKRVSGNDLTSVKINSDEGKRVLSSPNIVKYFKTVPGGGIGQNKLKLKPHPDSDIYFGYNQAFQTTKNAWLQKGESQKDAEQYAAAAAREFAVTRKGGSFLPGSKNGLDPTLADVAVASGDTSAESSTKSKDPFDLMDQAIKAVSVGMGLATGVSKGIIKDETTFKAVQTQLNSVADITIKELNATPPVISNNVEVVSQGSEKIITIERGGSRVPVGKMLHNMCVPNYG